MNRNLDGYYFRVLRDGKYENICFSDLTDAEMETILKDRTKTWIKSLCMGLAHNIKKIGNELDIVGGEVTE